MWGWFSRMIRFNRSSEPQVPDGYEDELISKLNRLFSDGIVNNKDYRCVPYTGRISHLNDRVAVIDQQYYFHVQNTKIPCLKVGDTVSCVLYLNDVETLVKKVEIAENPEDSLDKTKVENKTHEPKTKSKVDDDNSYQVKGVIVKKVLRDITVESDDVRCPSITFNMDCVRAEFMPQSGDLVTLDCCLLKSSRKHPQVVVEEIHPENTVVESGVVTGWDSIQGNINNCAYFSIQSCEPGYQPAKGDKVLASLIRSNVKHFAWRAIQVIPQSRATDLRMMKETEKARKELMNDKQGICVGTASCFQLTMGEENCFFIEVANNSPNPHSVLSCVSNSNLTSQIQLVDPSKWPVVIQPLGRKPFKFQINAQYLGRSSELYIWSFENFTIGRQFEFDVVDPDLACDDIGSSKGKVRGRRKEVTASQLIARCSGVIMPGRRSFSPAAFVPVKLGQFALSEKVLMASLPEDKLNLDDLMIRVSEVLPSLKEDLSRHTYADRMHSLLYLEEVAMLKQVGELQMEATFKKIGDCLVLTVPALSPYTTKLVAGDMLIASSADSSNSTEPNKYEGVIHKVTSTQIWLQFAEDFHEFFTEDNHYTVSFVTSRASLRRMHQAVNLAAKHLGMSWLFPSSIQSREPQVIVEDELPEETMSSHGAKSKGNEIPEKLLQLMKSLPTGSTSTAMKQLTNDWEKSESKTEVLKTVKEEHFLYGPDPRKLTVQLPSSKLSIKQKLQTPVVRSSVELHQGQEYRRGPRSRGRGRGKMHWNRHGSGYGVHVTLDSESKVNIQGEQMKTIKWYNRGLNEQQKSAVRNVLSGEARPLPYILFGPPGTGKTITVVETILQLYSLIPQSRLLVATPSNSAADLITERILACSNLKQKDLLRMVGYHYLEQGRINASIVPYSAVPDVKAINISGASGSSHEGVKMCGRELLGHHRITVGTLGCLGLLYNMGFPRGHFTHVVVDEAGQATEPEVLIPMVFLHMQFGQVILAGDPLQLGPVVTSRLAARCGLQDSLLARLLSRYPYAKDTSSFPDTWGYDPRLVTKLVFNYRSLPKILKLPSMLFYDNDLISNVSEENSEEAEVLRAVGDKIPCSSNGAAPPILFHGVRGKNEQEVGSHSWFNPQEMVQVVLYLVTLYSQGITADQIGVITPYQLQSNKIRFMLERMGMEAPKVGSVEEFQGQERMVIIVSVVRSSPEEITHDMQRALGFVANARRLNVALSRARAMLIIIGNPHLLSLDMHWRSVLHFCVEAGAYVGCDLPSESNPIQFMDKTVEYGR